MAEKNTISKTIEQKAWPVPPAAGLGTGVAKTAFLWIINFLSSHHRPKCKGRPEEGKEVLVKFDGHLIYANRMREMKLGKGKSKQTKIKIWNRKLALLRQSVKAKLRFRLKHYFKISIVFWNSINLLLILWWKKFLLRTNTCTTAFWYEAKLELYI